VRQLLWVLFLAGCGANVIQSTPNFVIVDHNGNRAGFSKALQAAAAECAKHGKAASMDRQTCQGSCTTQFRCE